MKKGKMFLKTKETKEAIVVCERRLSGECSRESCPAYRENKLNAKECHKLDTGQCYYNYSCSEGAGYGDSPYQCFSAFAGNPYLISFDALVEDGLLAEDDFVSMPAFNAARVKYGQLIPWKLYILEKAFARFSAAPERLHEEFDNCVSENASWLEDYALFMSIKEANGGGPWSEWEEAICT